MTPEHHEPILVQAWRGGGGVVGPADTDGRAVCEARDWRSRLGCDRTRRPDEQPGSAHKETRGYEAASSYTKAKLCDERQSKPSSS